MKDKTIISEKKKKTISEFPFAFYNEYNANDRIIQLTSLLELLYEYIYFSSL